MIDSMPSPVGRPAPTGAAPPRATRPTLRFALPFFAAVLIAMLFVFAGCGPEADGRQRGEAPRGDTSSQAPVGPPPAEDLLAHHLERIDERMTAVDSIFQPLPLLRSAQEQALRRSPYGDQLARARALGVGRSPSAARLDTLRRQGRLVALTDNAHWIVRPLNYSEPLVVPALRDALAQIGARFRARLQALDAPPFRLEISSALRTAADQRALRRVNPNAAAGESTHEYGTSVDLAYSAFAAPAEPVADVSAADLPWAETYLRRYQDVAAGRVAARRALELKAILGEVLLDVQRDGLVMITMERRQPVFHLTLAR